MNTLSRYLGAAPLLLGFSMAIAQTATSSTSSTPAQTAAPDPAAGYYYGKLSNGSPASVVVIDNGQFWLVTSAAPDGPRQVVEGYGMSRGGTFSSGWAAAIGFAQPIPLNLSATYSPGIGMDGSLQGLSAPLGFSVTYDQAYDIPYAITGVTGSYSGSLQVQNELHQATMAIDSNGALTGSLSLGSSVQAIPPCRFSGTVQQQSPRANPYNFQISFADVPSCGFGPDVIFSGVMTVSPTTPQGGGVTLVLIGSDERVSTLIYMIVSTGAGTGTGGGTTPTTTSPAAPAPAPTLPGSFILE